VNKALAIVFSLIGIALASPLVCAAPAGAPKRIGILYQDPGVLAQIDKFRETLQGLGFIEGKTVGYEYRLAGDDLQGAARDLAQSGVDLIVTPGTPAALAAKRATASVPIDHRVDHELGAPWRERHWGRIVGGGNRCEARRTAQRVASACHARGAFDQPGQRGKPSSTPSD
jgi:hypothetical protein